MKESVLQSKDFNLQIKANSQLPPKTPANHLKRPTALIKNIQPEEKKKSRENSHSVNAQPSQSLRNNQYPHEQYLNQQLNPIQNSQKAKYSNKKRRSASKSDKNRTESPVNSTSFTAGSYPDIIDPIQIQNSKSQGISKQSFILKKSLTKNPNQIESSNSNQELQIQLNMKGYGQSNGLISPHQQTSNYLNGKQETSLPYDYGQNNISLKVNKTTSNFKISNQTVVPRKKSLVSLESLQPINQASNTELNTTKLNNRKPQSAIRIRSGKLLNSTSNGLISPLENNLRQNSSNRNINNFYELNSLRNSSNKTTIEKFKEDEIEEENIQSIQYTQFNQINDYQKNNETVFDSKINSNKKDYGDFIDTKKKDQKDQISPQSVKNQFQNTQRQSSIESNLVIKQNQNNNIGRRWNEDNLQSRHKQTRSASSNRKSITFNSMSISAANKKGMLEKYKIGEAQFESEDNEQVDNQLQHSVLRLQLMTKKHNWRDLVKNKLADNQYTEIYLSFYDIIVELYDGLLFNNQINSLRYLNLNFKENKYFNNESLSFLSTIKLPSLQHVQVNLSATSCSRIHANLLLFDFNYVPEVEVIVGDYFHEQILSYKKENKFIQIDFSVQKSISRTEILSLSDAIFKTNHKDVKINLNNVRDLNHEKLKILGRCIQEVENINISFQSCKMVLIDLTEFINGLTYNKQNPALQIQPIQQNIQSNKESSKNFQDDRVIYDENDQDILANKPISYWIKREGIKNKVSSQSQSQIELNTIQIDEKSENNFIKELSIDFRQNNEIIDQNYMNIFKRFNTLDQIIIYIDTEKQVKQQYDQQVQAYCLGEHLKDSSICVDIRDYEDRSIFCHNKNINQIKVNVSNCDISAFQLVDILRSLNSVEGVIDLELDLSDNWQVTFHHLRKLFEKLIYFDKLKRMVLNIKSVYIYEVEFITLYFILIKIPDIKIIHDFENAKLVEMNNQQLKLAFKGPFSRSKINNLQDMDNFCLAFDSCQFSQIQDIQMTFFFNYGLRGDSLLRLCSSIARFPQLEKLYLNFNSCFLQFSDIVVFCDGLKNIDTTLKQLKLTFTNNDKVTNDSMIKLAQTLQSFSQLDYIDIICETHELHYNPSEMIDQNIFKKFNTKSSISRRNPKQKLSVLRVIPKIYQILSHDIEQTDPSNLKDQLKQYQNQYLSSTDAPDIQDQVNTATQNSNNLPSVESSISINKKKQNLTGIQIEDTEPPKRNKILRTAEQYWISLEFIEGIQYTEDELMNLGYSLAQQDSINSIITIPQKPILENIFNEIKASRIQILFFSILIQPEIDLDAIEILSDLYN